MKFRKSSLPVAALMVLGSVQMAAAQQTISIPDGSGFNEAREDALNLTFPSVVTTGYTVGNTFTVGGAPLLTANHTFDYASEAAIAIYNDGFPGLFCSATMGGLAGTYTAESLPVGPRTMTGTLIGSVLAASSTTTFEMYETFNDNIGGADAFLSGGTTIRLDVEVPPPPPGPGDTLELAIDLGTISASNSTLTTQVAPFLLNKLKYYKFNVGLIDVVNNDYLSIWTSNGTNDTEIGVYDASGNLVSSDDDDSTGLLSSITYGAFPGADPGDLTAQDDPVTLAAGTYYIITGTFNVTFGATNFEVTSTGPAGVGYDLNLATTVAAGSSQTLTGTLNLNDTSGTFAFNRAISYAVKQGTTTVASGTVTADASSESFSISVPASATGAATIEWDGSSFLMRKTNINLTGSNLAVGSVSVQNGDVDNSGEVDAADIDEVIADFGDTSNNPSDVDVSGEVDAADIDIVIANFGGVND